MQKFSIILMSSLFLIWSFFPIGAARPSQEDLYEFGIRIHSIMSAYQSSDDKANIFLPIVQTPTSEGDYLKRKGKICIFASGGVLNAWEKTVSKAYFSLYDVPIKIIRASWVRKHLDPDLETHYKPQDLHSELFFLLYVKKFKSDTTKVNGFSWWRP